MYLTGNGYLVYRQDSGSGWVVAAEGHPDAPISKVYNTKREAEEWAVSQPENHRVEADVDLRSLMEEPPHGVVISGARTWVHGRGGYR